ncbi:MAG: branched-chain amino acid ABC transporter permease [Planctomycetota bacterium]|jgi:branched-chain amino acid transport system permease protein
MKRLLRMLPLGEAIASRDWRPILSTLLMLIAVVWLPTRLGFDHRIINVFLFVAVYAILALGLNVVVGYTGLLDLGYVTFLATGAIVTFDLLLLVNQPGVGLTLPLGATTGVSGTLPFGFDGGLIIIMLIAGGVCALIGVLRGIPTLKLTGDYYAIVTLGIAEIIYLVYLNESSFTGGAFGMKLELASRPVLFGEKLYFDTPQFYFLVMATLGLVVLLVDRLNRSRTGRAWAAIRLDETAARACGINVNRYKMIAFAVSGFIGGVGGSLYAVWSGTVAAKALDIWQSILILCAVVLGGMGSIKGVLVGSVILFSLREVLREHITIGSSTFRVPPEASFLVYGLLLVVIMRFRPQGIWPRSQSKKACAAADTLCADASSKLCKISASDSSAEGSP